MDNKKIESSLKTILKGSLIVLGGTVIGQLLNLFFKVIVARYFGPEDYGWFSLALAVVVMSSSISGMGLSQSMARFLPFFKERKEQEKLSYTIRFGVKLSLTGSLLICLAILLAAPWLSKALHGEKSFTIFLMLFALVVPIEVIFDYSLGVIRGMKDMRMMVLCENVVLWSVRLAVLGLIALIGLGVKWMVMAYFASYALGLAVSWAYIMKKRAVFGGKGLCSESFRDPGLRKELITYTVPLMFSNITTMFRQRFDVILVGLFLTASQVGLYNVALPVASLMSVFLFAINRIAMPVASGLYSSESEQEMVYIYKTIAKWCLMISLPMFFMLFLFPDKIIGMLFGDEYQGAVNVLRILAAGFLANSMSGSFGEYLQSYSKTRSIFIISITGTGLNLALMVVLIPAYGIEGAALSLSTSLVWMCLLGNVYMYHYKKAMPFSREYLSTILIGAGIFSGAYLLQAQISSFGDKYVLALVIATSLILYAVLLFFLATNAFDREILRAIIGRSLLAKRF